MKNKVKTLLISIAIPLLVGTVASLLTMGSMEHYATLEQPPLSPPGWLFPIVWTVLYVLMGIACYRIVRSGIGQDSVTKALKVYGLQLVFNFFWTIIFFNFDFYTFAFIWLLILWALIIVNIYLFAKIDRISAILLVPYFLWVTFAAYLNFGIAILN